MSDFDEGSARRRPPALDPLGEVRRALEDQRERARNRATGLGPLPRFDPAKNIVSGHVVDAALKVHSALGPGLLESAYEPCLAADLRGRGLKVRTQVPFGLVYGDLAIGVAYRADLIVGDEVLVEVKSVAQWSPVIDAQVATYLKLSGLPIGLVLNFNVKSMRNGIRRIIRRGETS